MNEWLAIIPIQPGSHSIEQLLRLTNCRYNTKRLHLPEVAMQKNALPETSIAISRINWS
jgi:hypothetical protein